MLRIKLFVFIDLWNKRMMMKMERRIRRLIPEDQNPLTGVGDQVGNSRIYY
jgi:hypothetical protein